MCGCVKVILHDRTLSGMELWATYAADLISPRLGRTSGMSTHHPMRVRQVLEYGSPATMSGPKRGGSSARNPHLSSKTSAAWRSPSALGNPASIHPVSSCQRMAKSPDPDAHRSMSSHLFP